MRIAISAYMTSKDLLELASKMQKIEKTAKIGDSTVAGVWNVPSPDSMVISVHVTCDQERARRQGLMK